MSTPEEADGTRGVLRARVPLLALAIIALLGALWGGLLRLGWPWPLLHPPLVMAHGPLMVSGFLGTLICLERAVALNRRWTYAAPIFSGLGALVLMVGGAGWLGPLLLTLGSVWLVAIFAQIIRQQPVLFTATMGLGALSWLVGNLLWLSGRAIPEVVLWWLGFLVITIVGERLELGRVLKQTHWRIATFAGALGLFIAGLLLSLLSLDTGMRVSGAGMLALALWLLGYDIARRTVRRTGLTRFIAVALLLGYGWLATGGGLMLWLGDVRAGPAYDAMLHAVFVGFVISMVFGHAPIIFPAVLRIPVTYDWSCYVPLILLHTSLLARVCGDLDLPALRQSGGLLNAIAILLFFGNTLRLARAAPAQPVSAALAKARHT